MKSFKELSRTKKVLTIAAGVLAGSLFLLDDQENEFAESGGYPATEYAAYPGNNSSVAPNATTMNAYVTNQSNPTTSGGGQRVEIYDQGLQMPMSTIVLPEGWNLVHDIAFDPSTAIPTRFKYELTGPQGELGRAFTDVFLYGAPNGKTREQAYQEALAVVLKAEDLEQPSLGTLQPSPGTESKKIFQRMAQKLQRKGQQVNALEVSVTGQRKGRAYQGRIVFNNLTQQSSQGEIGALQPMFFFISPAEHYDASLALVESMDDQTVTNPAHEERLDQIGQRQEAAHQQRMANIEATSRQNMAAHQQRMADQQASFNAHQQNMAQRSQAQDASFNQYMNNAQSSYPSSSSSSEYSSQDAFVDQIHGSSTFNDPDTGFEKQLDGQYDYNYTNGLGDYYRTNDPSFDQNSLQGDWQQTEPLSSDY